MNHKNMMKIGAMFGFLSVLISGCSQEMEVPPVDPCAPPTFQEPECSTVPNTYGEGTRIVCPAGMGEEWTLMSGVRIKYLVQEGTEHDMAKIECDEVR